jgi:hypothetical protein
LGLSALFEGLEVLEDPFTAYLALDGIDVREEFEVLYFAQLLSTRRLVFPNAPNYPAGRRAALIGGHSSSTRKHHLIGLPPTQIHHERYKQHSRGPSHVPSLVNIGTAAMADVAPAAAVPSNHDTTTHTTSTIGISTPSPSLDPIFSDFVPLTKPPTATVPSSGYADDEDDDGAFDLDDHVDIELGPTLMGEEDTFLAHHLRRESVYGDDDDHPMASTRSQSPSRHWKHVRTRTLSGGSKLSRRRQWNQQQEI